MKTSKSTLPVLLQRFFCEYLIQQRRVSAHTVDSYRDTMRLLLSFLHVRLGRPPELLQLQDLTAPNISEFLDYCEAERGNSARTRKKTGKMLREWVRDNELSSESPLLSNARGIAMTRSGVEKRLARAVSAARKKCPSLKEKKVTPHTIRHTTAMHLLQSGVALTLIALWLGHEDLSTTHIYMTSDLKMKERALNALQDTPAQKRRFQPSDTLLRFLDSL